MDLAGVAIAPSSDDDLETIHAQNHQEMSKDVLSGSSPTPGQTQATPESLSPVSSPVRARGPGRTVKMTFSSSPVLYPASSSPPPIPQKRKLFHQRLPEPLTKKARIRGGFLQDDEDQAPAREPQPPASGLAQDTSVQEVLDVDDISSTSRPEVVEEPTLPVMPRLLMRKRLPRSVDVQTSAGLSMSIPLREKSQAQTYEQLVAQRSVTTEGRAKKAYYGIQIHKLMDDARIQQELDQAEAEAQRQKLSSQSAEEILPQKSDGSRNLKDHQMWTEKYRAKKFTDLVGDERTHRSVLRWLKAWDEIVFPRAGRLKSKKIFEDKNIDHEKQHRKILLLTGPPGLGKTTLAHVCAKQAGYEVLEINASDDRSRDVVRGRIKDAVGTETVRGVKEGGKARKAGRPVCVIVDEVDGAVTGSGGSGEGGFIKALLDLAHLDQRNSIGNSRTGDDAANSNRKGDRFRLLRPLILICNDAYAPSLRPLRTSSFAEIVHVRRPALDKVILRLRNVLEMEKIAYDNDAVRRVCEVSWGLGTRKQNSLGGHGAGEGDIRGILVQAEWMVHKFRSGQVARLTRKWVESQLAASGSASGQKGLGRGGSREIVDRVFIDGAGIPNLPTILSADDARLVAENKSSSLGIADLRKRAAISALREMADMHGEHDRLITDCFAAYPAQPIQDDGQFSKPNAGHDWLHFHDCLSTRVYGGQEWELNPYLSSGVCGFHNLFATIDKGDRSWGHEEHQRKEEVEESDIHPFSGLRADFAAYETEKANRTLLTELQGAFSGELLRLFSSVDNIATELLPNVSRMLAPDVKPVVVGGSGGSASVASVRKESERNCVKNAVRVMSGLGIKYDKVKIELDERSGIGAKNGFVYRMEPPIDTLIEFHLGKSSDVANAAPVRYAVRQVLDQELRKAAILQNSVARHARSSGLPYDHETDNKENEGVNVKAKTSIEKISLAKVQRDFFGRIINETRPTSSSHLKREQASTEGGDGGRVWVSFHEGFSNAVRKPITLREMLDSFSA